MLSRLFGDLECVFKYGQQNVLSVNRFSPITSAFKKIHNNVIGLQMF